MQPWQQKNFEALSCRSLGPGLKLPSWTARPASLCAARSSSASSSSAIAFVLKPQVSLPRTRVSKPQCAQRTLVGFCSERSGALEAAVKVSFIVGPNGTLASSRPSNTEARWLPRTRSPLRRAKASVRTLGWKSTAFPGHRTARGRSQRGRSQRES